MPEDANTPTTKRHADVPAAASFRSLQDEMERLFHAFSLPELHWPTGSNQAGDALGLRIDVSESDTAILISAELPGVKEEDLEVALENDLLRISAVKSTEDTQEDKTWHVTERSYGKLERAVRVPRGIDPDSIKAVHKNGVLNIEIPKPADMAASARKIAVESA